jgi:Protein of unknown function (DUF1565)
MLCAMRHASRTVLSLLFASLGASFYCACVTSSDSPPAAPGFEGGTFDGSGCGALCVDAATTPDTAPPDDGAIPDDGAVPDVAVDATPAVDAASLKDVFVDATTGVDTNPGTSVAPVKTIAKALTLVPAGSTVWLADGAYTVANQGGLTTLALPAGASLSAKNAGLATISGFPLTASLGSNVLSGIVLDKGSSLVANSAAATAATLTLNGVSFTSDASTGATLNVGGSVKATVNQAVFSGNLRFGTVQVGGAAELTLVGGTIDGGGVGGPGFGASLITASGTSKVTLDGVAMKNSLTPAIGAAGSTPGTPVTVLLKNGTVLDTLGSAGNCAANAALILSGNVSVTLDASEIKNAKGGGICVRNGFNAGNQITLQNGAKLTNDVAGILSENGTESEATVVINGATIASNVSAGISWTGAGSFDIAATTFTGNASAIFTNSGTNPLTVKVRNSSLVNSTAYGVQAVAADNSLALDLGTVASPGGNTITGNGTTGIRLGVPATQTHFAVGNTWNPSIEGADAAGHYTAGTAIVGPAATGTNYQLVNATTLTL